MHCRQVLRPAERGVRVPGAAPGPLRRAGRARRGAGRAAAPRHHPRQLPALPQLPRQARAQRPRPVAGRLTHTNTAHMLRQQYQSNHRCRKRMVVSDAPYSDEPVY